MSNFKPNFSEGLKRARKNAGYKTQQDFADALPKSLNAVQKWEQGKSFPSLGEFIDLCQFFNCDADYLLGNIENVTHDLDFVCKYTGLSAEAVAILQYMDIPSRMIIDRLVQEYSGNGYQIFTSILDAADAQAISSNYPDRDYSLDRFIKIQDMLIHGSASTTLPASAEDIKDLNLDRAAREFRVFAKECAERAAKDMEERVKRLMEAQNNDK